MNGHHDALRCPSAATQPQDLHTQAGRTVLNTVGAFLVVSLASPVYDLARLRNTQAAEPGSRLQWNSRCPCRRA